MSRIVEDWEFNAAKELAPPHFKLFMEFAYLTGLRRDEILGIQLTDLTDEGIIVETIKYQATILIKWSDELKNLVTTIRALHNPDSPTEKLFCNHKGNVYTVPMFITSWHRVMFSALEQGVIEKNFTFGDLRHTAIQRLKTGVK